MIRTFSAPPVLLDLAHILHGDKFNASPRVDVSEWRLSYIACVEEPILVLLVAHEPEAAFVQYVGNDP